jgi:hypothetical protein
MQIHLKREGVVLTENEVLAVDDMFRQHRLQSKINIFYSLIVSSIELIVVALLPDSICGSTEPYSYIIASIVSSVDSMIMAGIGGFIVFAAYKITSSFMCFYNWVSAVSMLAICTEIWAVYGAFVLFAIIHVQYYANEFTVLPLAFAITWGAVLNAIDVLFFK